MTVSDELEQLHRHLSSGSARGLDCLFQALGREGTYPKGLARYGLRETDPLVLNAPESGDDTPAALAARLAPLMAQATTDDARLTLLERFGGFVAAVDERGQEVGGVSWYDAARVRLALAGSGDETLVVRADLSGIQDFIYDVPDDRALRNLRARSFYLELLSAHVLRRVLALAGVSRAHVSFVGGGGFQVLLPATAQDVLDTYRRTFDDWLWTAHGGQLSLALDWVRAPTASLRGAAFAETSRELSRRLARLKARRRRGRLAELFAEPSDGRATAERRDALNRSLIALGGRLPRATHIEVSDGPPEGEGWVRLDARWYRPTRNPREGERYAVNSLHDLGATPLLVGNHVTRVGDVPTGWRVTTGEPEEANHIASHEQFAALALGQPRLALYRCDADNMGRFFAGGIPGHTIERHATLSRLMALFFQGYANAVAARTAPLLPGLPQAPREGHGRYLNFVYSGGDDAIVVGAWNEVLTFAVDLRRAYRAFTGGNPQLGLSGGSFVAKAKYPLARMADGAERAETLAKQARRPGASPDAPPDKDGFVPFLLAEGEESAASSQRWDVFMNLVGDDGLERTLGVLALFLKLARRADEHGIELATSRGFLWKLRDFVDRDGDVWRLPLLHYAIARTTVPPEFERAWQDLRRALLKPETWPHLGAVLSFLHLARPAAQERETDATERSYA